MSDFEKFKIYNFWNFSQVKRFYLLNLRIFQVFFLKIFLNNLNISVLFFFAIILLLKQKKSLFSTENVWE